MKRKEGETTGYQNGTRYRGYIYIHAGSPHWTMSAMISCACRDYITEPVFQVTVSLLKFHGLAGGSSPLNKMLETEFSSSKGIKNRKLGRE